jgi:DNA alkylation damage repair protein AlkB
VKKTARAGAFALVSPHPKLTTETPVGESDGETEDWRLKIEGQLAQAAEFSKGMKFTIDNGILANEDDALSWLARSDALCDGGPNNQLQSPKHLLIVGFKIIPQAISPKAQAGLRDLCREQLENAPLYQSVMPKTEQPFSILQINMGTLGWVSDKQGYRYQPHHPDTGRKWPIIPEQVLELWQNFATYAHPPECCLINLYKTPKARMGLHRDDDENDMNAPVLDPFHN